MTGKIGNRRRQENTGSKQTNEIFQNLSVGTISHNLHEIEDPCGILHRNNIFSAH